MLDEPAPIHILIRAINTCARLWIHPPCSLLPPMGNYGFVSNNFWHL